MRFGLIRWSKTNVFKVSLWCTGHSRGVSHRFHVSNQQTRVEGQDSLHRQCVPLKQRPAAKLLPLHSCKSKNNVIELQSQCILCTSNYLLYSLLCLQWIQLAIYCCYYLTFYLSV